MRPFAALVIVFAITLSAAPDSTAAPPFSSDWGAPGQLVDHGDLNGDGDLELVVGYTVDSRMRIVDSGTGATLYVLNGSYGPGSNVQILMDEFDGTPFPEMVVSLPSPQGNTTLGIIEWNGSTYAEKWRLSLPGPPSSYVSTGRFVSGVQHLVIDVGSNLVLRRPSDGAIDYDWNAEHPGVVVLSREILDLDGDGLQEILVDSRNAQGNEILYLVRPTGPLAVSDEPAFASRLVLGQNTPNPFVRETEVMFEMPRRDRAVVRVFDPAGRLVRTVVDGTVEAGRQRVAWDGHDKDGHQAPSGTYFLDVTVAGDRQTRKMVRLE